MTDLLERNHSDVDKIPAFRNLRGIEASGGVQPFMVDADARLTFCAHEHWRDRAMILELSLDEWLVCAKPSTNKSSASMLPSPPADSPYPQLALERYTFIRNNGTAAFSTHVLGKQGLPKFVVSPQKVVLAGIHGSIFRRCKFFTEQKLTCPECGDNSPGVFWPDCGLWPCQSYTSGHYANIERCLMHQNDSMVDSTEHQTSHPGRHCAIHHIIDPTGHSDQIGKHYQPTEEHLYPFASATPRTVWADFLFPGNVLNMTCNRAVEISDTI